VDSNAQTRRAIESGPDWSRPRARQRDQGFALSRRAAHSSHAGRRSVLSLETKSRGAFHARSDQGPKWARRRAPCMEGALLERWLAQCSLTGSTIHDRATSRSRQGSVEPARQIGVVETVVLLLVV